MKTLTKNTLFIAILAVMIPLSSMAQPGPRFRDNDRRGLAYNECRLEQVIPDLTDEQSEQLKALRLDQLESSQKYRNEMGEIRAKQRTLMSENPINQGALEDLIDDKAALMKAHQKDVLAHRVAVSEVLTEDQLLVYNQFSQRRGMIHRGVGQARYGRGGRGYDGPGRGMGPCGRGNRW